LYSSEILLILGSGVATSHNSKNVLPSPNLSATTTEHTASTCNTADLFDDNTDQANEADETSTTNNNANNNTNETTNTTENSDNISFDFDPGCYYIGNHTFDFDVVFPPDPCQHPQFSKLHPDHKTLLLQQLKFRTQMNHRHTDEMIALQYKQEEEKRMVKKAQIEEQLQLHQAHGYYYFEGPYY
jgi:hypothetical protein